MAVVNESREHASVFPVGIEVGDILIGKNTIDPSEQSSFESENCCFQGYPDNHFVAYLVVKH